MGRISRRKDERRALRVPLAVHGFENRTSPWSETTTTLDVSVGGASFNLYHPVAVGQVLNLQMPLPAALRRYDVDAPTYSVFAIVRHVGGAKPPHAIGVRFHGKTAPAGFKHNPTASFLVASSTPDVRRARRHPVMLVTKLRLVKRAREETTVTENLSEGGALLLSTLGCPEGEPAFIDIDNGAIRGDVRVLGCRDAKNGVRKLSVAFASLEMREEARAHLRRLGFV